MKRPRRVPLVVAGLLLAGAAACTNAPGPSPSPTASTSPPPPPCPVGTWQSTGVAASPSVAGVTLTVAGAAGVKMTVALGGKVTADFSAMKPATLTTQVGSAQVRAEITYQGTTDGTLDLSGSASPSSSSPMPSTPGSTSSGPTASPLTAPSTVGPTVSSTASGASGPWTPTGPVNMDQLRITIKLTQPLATTLVDNLKVTDVTGAQTAQMGNAVDLQPLLRQGTYQCDGEKGLTITTSGAGPALVWTMTRM